MPSRTLLFIVTLTAGLAMSCGGDDDVADATVTVIDASSIDADLTDADLTDADLADAESFDAPGVLGFLDECDLENDLCDGTLEPPLFCWDYPSKGPHCTHSCTLPEECEAPSPGCSGQLVCRVP